MNSNYTDYISNTVYTNSSSAAFYQSSGSGTKTLKNNIIVNTNTGSGSYGFQQSGGSLTSSFNRFYSRYSAANGANHSFGIGDGEYQYGGDSDPLFANTTPGIEDFHLKSEYGRYDPVEGWVTDEGYYSQCIDIGSNYDEYRNEPAPNGGRINMGAYGNTPEASKSGPATVALYRDGVALGTYTTIYGAVGQIPDTLDARYDVVVNSDQTYNEDVYLIFANENLRYYVKIAPGLKPDSTYYKPTISGGRYCIYVKNISGSDLYNVMIHRMILTGATENCIYTTREGGDNVRNMKVTNCKIYDSNQDLINMNYTYGFIIANNIMYKSNAASYLVRFNYCDNNSYFYNNTVYGSASTASVYTTNGTFMIIKNNIIINTNSSGGYAFNTNSSSITGLRTSFNYFGSSYNAANGSSYTLGINDAEYDYEDNSPEFYDADSKDFHLKSIAGRWNVATESWAIDAVHSIAIDAGDPFFTYSVEPFYNGELVNQGGWGNTEYASKSVNNTISKLWTGIINDSWDEGANWSPSGVPASYDEVIIPSDPEGPYWPVYDGNFEISSTGACATLIMDNSSRLTILGSITIGDDGIFNVVTSADPVIFIHGDWANNGLFSMGNSNVSFVGSDTSIIHGGGLENFFDLTIDKTGTGRLQLGTNLSINGSLKVDSDRSDDGTSGGVETTDYYIEF